MTIDNPGQLLGLHARYCQLLGARQAAQAAQQQVDALNQGFLDALGLVLGQTIPPDATINIDFSSGEVSIEQPHLNGVAMT